MSKYFIITILAILFLLPQAVSAAGLVPCGGPPPEEPCNICHIFQMLQIIIQGAMLAILAWAVVFILIGGIILLTSGGSAEQASRGKKTITYAIIGIIVAFGAWLIINTIMNYLVDQDKMPWPWNKIDCTPTEPIIITHKECVGAICKDVEGEGADKCTKNADCGEVVEGKICRCEWENGEVYTEEYSSSERCQQWCPSTCMGALRYCCVDNVDDECEGPISAYEKKYCIGEIPVYTVDPHNYSGKTEVIGTEFKGTELASEDECTQKCAFPNGYVYLPQRNLTDASEGKLYCASQNELEGKTAHCVETKTGADYLRPFSSQQACLDSIDPDKAGFDKECARFCWVDGNKYCDCQWRPPKYQLRRTTKEQGTGLHNTAWACIRNCNYDCRLGHHQEPTGCEGEPEDNCGAVVDQYSCFGSFTCKNMTRIQEANACSQLSQLLSCMAGKGLPDSAKAISSISDNSGNKCFDISFWDSVRKCSEGTDSCTWTCCGHKRDSLHYGGIGGADCRSCSWAVDLSSTTLPNFDKIKKAAQDCGSELWSGGLGKVDVVKETNPPHIHIELDGIADYHNCK